MNVLQYIQQLDKELPHFPDGRIDYTRFAKPPALNLIVSAESRVLLLKRSEQVLAYKGMWNCLGGFLDEVKPVEEKMLEELWEELSVARDQVVSLELGEVREIVDRQIGRTWMLVPGLALLKSKPEVVLDFEHTDFAWVKPAEVGNYNIVPGLDKLVMSFVQKI